jgi:hypothetical protein
MDRVETYIDRPVRPIVTVLFAAAVVYGFIVGTVSADAFLGLAGAVVGFWFQGRQTPKPGPEASAER